jgi:hypothetical protein
MQCAKLRVTDELFNDPAFILPPGYLVIHRAEIGYGVLDLTIQGPFPDSLSPYSVLRPMITKRVDRLTWEWRLDGVAVGQPIDLPLTLSQHPFAA